jgi:anthranilate 1,2-dioxygenase small subunit
MRVEDYSEADLHRAVMILQADYAEAIDEDRLETWPDFFADKCLYRILPRENADRGLMIAPIFCDSRGMLVDRVVALRKANIYPLHRYQHILSTTRIHAIEHEVIRARTSYLVLRTRNNGLTTIYNAGNYQDEIVMVDGLFRFRSKTAIFDTNRVDTLMVMPI